MQQRPGSRVVFPNGRQPRNNAEPALQQHAGYLQPNLQPWQQPPGPSRVAMLPAGAMIPPPQGLYGNEGMGVLIAMPPGHYAAPAASRGPAMGGAATAGFDARQGPADYDAMHTGLGYRQGPPQPYGGAGANGNGQQRAGSAKRQYDERDDAQLQQHNRRPQQQQPQQQQQRGPLQQAPAAWQQQQPPQQQGGAAGDPSQLYGSLGWARSKQSSQGHVYTILGRNIVETVDALTPDASELRERWHVLQEMEQIIRAALPEYARTLQVLPFGSFVSGLGTKASDIDIVIVGVREPRAHVGFYEKDERPAIARLLDRVVQGLRRSQAFPLRNLFVIRSARFPLAKVTLSNGLSVDVSIASKSGPDAANFLAQKMAQYRGLRPLVLILKAYLKVSNLNDVSTGGLSSYGLTYMVLAHLMEEAKLGNDVQDLGYMLHRFFRRYSSSNYNADAVAVSVKHGGLVPRAMIGMFNNRAEPRIATEDPLTGRNCTEGTYRAVEVLDVFDRADRFLREAASKYARGCPPDLDLLAGLLDELETPELADDEEPYTGPGQVGYVVSDTTKRRRGGWGA